MEWLKTAESKSIEKFHRFLKNGQISIAALPFHAAPGFTAEQMPEMLKPLRFLREYFNIPIKTAINHDINGQPWSVSQMLLDARVEFYITGINVHTGGVPFPRPAVFNWKTPDSRKLLTFLGEHYHLFSYFGETVCGDTDKLRKGIDEYLDVLEKRNYPYDFAYLTATNPPACDNNPPDPKLADLINRFNSEGHPYVIKFVTPEMLLERVRTIENIPEYGGDWTDYWNFGAGSTAGDVKVNRCAKRKLRGAEFLEAVKNVGDKHYQNTKERAIKNINLFEEHTWGADCSVTSPLSPLSKAGSMYKSVLAYQGADLSAYMINTQLESMAENPMQYDKTEGILAVNPTEIRQTIELCVPNDLLSNTRQLSALSSKMHIPYAEIEKTCFGSIELEPFSYKKITMDTLKQMKEQYEASERKYCVWEGGFETPFYRVSYDTATGRIESINDLKTSREILNTDGGYTFFECIRESIEPTITVPDQTSLYGLDLAKRHYSISEWNKEWGARRERASELISFEIAEEPQAVVYVLKTKFNSSFSLEQRITFSVLHNRICMEADIDKDEVFTPESIYFTFPLKLNEGWSCSFDSAGKYADLDKTQLGHCSKDWLTVDKTVSVYDKNCGITLACPDAPLVQVGGFRFGKYSEYVEREQNPLLLAWPMNNYWGTNFKASQPGKVSLRYELTPIDSFEPSHAFELGIMSEKAYEVQGMASCDEDTDGKLFEFSGSQDVRVQYIKKSVDGNVLIMLNHIGEKTQKISLSLPGKRIKKVCEVSVLEEVKNEIEIHENRIELTVLPQEFRYIKIEAE